MYDPKDLTPQPESFDELYTPSEEDNNLVNEPAHRSKRPKTVIPFGGDFIVYPVDDVPKTLLQAYATPNAEYTIGIWVTSMGLNNFHGLPCEPTEVT
jgi:hypothetical protein